LSDRLPDADLVELFLNGHCAAYAIAAARALSKAGATGVGISILIDEDGEPNTQDDRCVIHAYASCDRLDYDAEGPRTPDEMADGYGLNAYDIDGPFSEEEFLRFFCGPADEHDGLEADPQWITAAEDLIARRPDLISPGAES
jgi:hypothetical protein